MRAALLASVAILGCGDSRTPDPVTPGIDASIVDAPPDGPPSYFLAAQDLALPASSGPSFVIAADLDGDLHRDLAVIERPASTLAVLANRTPDRATQVTFAPAVTLPLGLDTAAVAAADLNGDDRLDLVTTSAGDNAVTVFMNTTPTPGATPSFAAGVDVSVDQAGALAIADIDGDGAPDLIVSTYDLSTSDQGLVVLLDATPAGAMLPTFGTRLAVTGFPVTSIATADLDGDGRLDLVTGGTTVQALINTTSHVTTPSFAAPIALAGLVPSDVVAGDVNLDGRPDVAFAVRDTSALYTLASTTAPGGAPSFAPAVRHDTASWPAALALGQFGDPPFPDLAIAATGDSAVSIVHGPAFVARLDYRTGMLPAMLALGDLNLDGKDDVAVVGAGLDAIVIRLAR